MMSIRRDLHYSLFVQMDQIRREFYLEVILLLLPCCRVYEIRSFNIVDQVTHLY